MRCVWLSEYSASQIGSVGLALSTIPQGLAILIIITILGFAIVDAQQPRGEEGREWDAASLFLGLLLSPQRKHPPQTEYVSDKT